MANYICIYIYIYRSFRFFGRNLSMYLLFAFRWIIFIFSLASSSIYYYVLCYRVMYCHTVLLCVFVYVTYSYYHYHQLLLCLVLSPNRSAPTTPTPCPLHDLGLFYPPPQPFDHLADFFVAVPSLASSPIFLLCCLFLCFLRTRSQLAFTCLSQGLFGPCLLPRSRLLQLYMINY